MINNKVLEKLSLYRFNHISVHSTTQEQSTTTLAATTTTVETTIVSVYETTEHTTTVPDAALTPTDRVATSEPQGVNGTGNNVVKTKNLSFSFSRDFAYGTINSLYFIQYDQVPGCTGSIGVSLLVV